MKTLGVLGGGLVIFAVLVVSICGLRGGPRQDNGRHDYKANSEKHEKDREEPPRPSAAGIAQADQHSEEERCGALDKVCWWLNNADPNRVVATFTAIAAIAAVAYVVVAGFQLGSLRRQVEHQILQARPMLVVKAPENGWPMLEPYPDGRSPRQVWVRAPWIIENIGKSPAWLYQYTIRVVPVPDRVPETPPPLGKEDAPFGQLPIAPEGGHSTPRTVAWTPEEAASVQPGGNCVLVYGLVRYRDGAERDYVTQFAFAWHDTIPNQAWVYDQGVCREWVKYT